MASRRASSTRTGAKIRISGMDTLDLELLLGTKLVSSVEVESNCVAGWEIPAGGEVAG